MDMIAKVRRQNGALDIFACDWVQLRPCDDRPDCPKPRYVALSKNGSQFGTIDMASDATDVYVEHDGAIVTHVARFLKAQDAEETASEPEKKTR